VAKMFVNEIFGGLIQRINQKLQHLKINTTMAKCWLKKTSPSILLASTIYCQLLVRAHVAYISNGTVVGLSKMNRIVDYYAKRPQVQERLTIQIVKELQSVLNTKMWPVLLTPNIYVSILEE